MNTPEMAKALYEKGYEPISVVQAMNIPDMGGEYGLFRQNGYICISKWGVVNKTDSNNATANQSQRSQYLQLLIVTEKKVLHGQNFGFALGEVRI